ncbi:MAG: TRM11 family SAM-dependent methyltransferase [Acidimicrobiales bacterium]
MLPDLARRIVTEYSRPGQLVVDPMAGTGTTLVEAALLGRRAIGVELETRWAALARANADHVLDSGARRLVEVRQGDAVKLAELLGDLSGRVDLVCTSPPYACDVGNPNVARYEQEGRIGRGLALNYSEGRANLGHARGVAYEEAVAAIYAACLTVLRPGGVLAVVTKNTRRKGRTLDLAGLTVAIAEQAGFTYLQHVVALHAAVRDGDLVGRPSYWQGIQVHHARERGEPVHLVVHEDLDMFLAPQIKEAARAR